MADPTTDLTAYVDAITLPDELDREWLTDTFLRDLGVTAEAPLGEIYEDLFLHASGQLNGELEMRPGGWRVSGRGTAIKAIMTSAFLGAALFAAGADEIPKEVLVAVMPLVVDIQGVRLNRRDKELLVRLRVSAQDLQGMALNPEVLYNRLDAAVRNRLNKDDFSTFVDHLVEAGEMDDAGYGDVRLRRADDPAWLRITWS